MGSILATTSVGTLLLDIQIPNTRFGTGSATPMDEAYHPHLVDVFEPIGTISNAMVVLHAGGGFKRQIAAQIGLLVGNPPTSTNVAWRTLKFWQCAAMFPQGQYCNGVNALAGAGNNPWNPGDVTTVSADYPNGVPNWSNNTFWSGVDDPQFLRDCSTWLLNRYGAVKRILAGHSSGGIMVQRMWSEHAVSLNDYGIYCSVSGPISADVAQATPAVVKPFCAQHGELDANLGIIGGHFLDGVWHQQPENLSRAVVTFPTPATWVGDFEQLQARVDLYNAYNSLPPETVSVGDGVTEAADIGTLTSWSYSGGANLMRLLSDGPHDLTGQQQCMGHRIFRTWMGFAAAH